MIEAVRLQISRQMRIDQPDLLALVRGVGFGDIGLALAQRLDLRAGQNQTGLVGADDLIIEARLAVFRDDLADAALRASGGHGLIFRFARDFVVDRLRPGGARRLSLICNGGWGE